MKEDAKIWLEYSEENLQAAKVLLESHLYNPCLQNVQQSVEKSLKAVFVEKAIKLKKSHNIFELKVILSENKINIDLADDECYFLDSIYLPSKYPIGSALPDFYPDQAICENSITLAERVLQEIKNILLNS